MPLITPARLDDRAVYFTLGTVFHQESGDLFHRVMAGLGGVDANSVITVGNEIDPDVAGTRPVNVHVERFVPQHALLPRCRVVARTPDRAV